MRLLLASAVLVAGLQQERAQAEIHLVPEGYVGWVVIAYGAANGEAPAFEGDARLYRIPRNGILLTAAAVNGGFGTPYQFFIEGPDGRRQRLPHMSPVADTPENRASPQVGLFAISRGVSTAKSGCRIQWDSYFVGTTAQYFDNQPRRLDPVRAAAMTYACP